MKYLHTSRPLPVTAVVLMFIVMLIAGIHGIDASQLMVSYASESLFSTFQKFSTAWVGDWKGLGQQFVHLQSGVFPQLFLVVVAAVPVAFATHYLIWGPKEFSHSGEKIKFYGAFIRFIHWIAAICMTLLAVTGLMIIFGKYIGGGGIVRAARYVHSPAAAGFAVTALILFLAWVKDMLPALCDIRWLFMAGGYLSREKRPVPAGRFNAGQKMWFWLATAGGMVMAWTGFYLFNHEAAVDELRLFAIIHNYLGAAILALFIVHLYMSLFAIKGSLSSMITGYKTREEVEIMHSLYRP